MSRRCVFKFLSVLGAGVGLDLGARMIHGANSADWQTLAYMAYGICVGMIVAWIVSMVMGKDDCCDDKKSCK